MAKPVRLNVDREDYYWMVRRYGNDGVRPAQCELIRRMRKNLETLEADAQEGNAVIKKVVE